MESEKKVNILLVDDHQENLLALSAALDGLDQTLFTASSGREALRLLLDYDFAVILLDVHMPEMDGFETAALIRERERSQSTPIIFLTAMSRNETQVFKGYSLGAVDYIFKPFEPEILKAKVSVFIELFKKTEEITRQARLLMEKNHELDEANDALEARVVERTLQLARINDTLQMEIVERKRAEEERTHLWLSEQEARKAAEEANRAKDEFLATVSHELRTPLTAILGWSRMLRSGKLDQETYARALDTIDRNAKAQVRLIEDILDVSRIITGKMRLEVRPVELAPLIEMAVDSMRPAAEAKSIQIRMNLNKEVGLVIGDPNRLQQVVWNLASNAVKFTPTGGEVSIDLFATDSHAHLSVKDTGEGIKTDFLPFVFDRFRQAESTTIRKHGGLGLGLAIVRHLVEMHGGEIHAESEGEGKGARFIVMLPVTTEVGAAQYGEKPITSVAQ